VRGVANEFLETWEQHSAMVPAGLLTYMVFPGGARPFVGCTRLDGRPISPTHAHRHLAEAGHEHAALKFLGKQPSTFGPFH
jgi:hypothetical protein